jgi:hypothetical protein
MVLTYDAYNETIEQQTKKRLTANKEGNVEGVTIYDFCS